MKTRIETNLMAIALLLAIATPSFAQISVAPPVHQHSATQHGGTVNFSDGMIAPVPAQPAQAHFSDATPIVVPSFQPSMPAPIIAACDCCEDSCSKCRLLRPFKCRCKRRGCRGECLSESACVQCPSCDGDVCKLSVKKEKEKKTCFKTKQEQICVPTVRLPWQKCCPPSVSETRLVNRLKKHTYECETCKYKWAVVESDNCGDSTTGTPTAAKAKDAEAEKPKAEMNQNEVPAAPKVKGAFLRPWRTR